MTSMTPPIGHNRLTDVEPPADVATAARDDIAAVIASASRAPSVHNTQPWRWRLDGTVLDLLADRTRQLQVADPDGHSLLISCGAAAELTGLSLAAQGWSTTTALLPDPTDPDLLARFQLTSHGTPDLAADQRSAAASRRRSDRRVFGPEPIAPEVIERLRVAAQTPGTYAHFALRSDESLDLAVAISRADRSERDDPAYAAEMAEWVRRDPATPDGVPASVIPELDDDHPRHTDIPLRDFEVGIAGSQLISAGVDERPLIAVIFTETDSPLQRLEAGRSMMRLMIAAELDGIASCPLSQSLDLLSFRSQLRTLMAWPGYPQMMLRLGMKPTSAPPPLTARRPVQDVLVPESVRAPLDRTARCVEDS
jgi:nitroreductase